MLWPEPVDSAVLLGDVASAFTRFVALPLLAEVAAALWTVHTHVLEAAAASPRVTLLPPSLAGWRHPRAGSALTWRPENCGIAS